MMKSSIPEELRLHARRDVRGGRAVMVLGVGVGGLHRLSSLTTCSTGFPVLALNASHEGRSRSQPERVSGNVEMTMSSGA